MLLGIGLGLGFVRSGARYEPEAAALFARFSAPPDSARKALINDLVRSLKTAGVWSKLDALYLMAAADNQAAKLNWIADQYNLTEVAAPTFTADRGFVGNGTSSYLDSGFNPATAVGAKFVRDSAYFAIWSRTTDQLTGSAAGWFNGTSGVSLRPRGNGGSADLFEARINQASAVSMANTDGRGWFSVNRDGASSLRLSKNAGTPTTASNASVALANGSIRFGSLTAASFNLTEFAAGALGQSLTTDEDAALYAAVDTYMTGVGANFSLAAEALISLYSATPTLSRQRQINQRVEELEELGKWPSYTGAVYSDDYDSIDEAMAAAVSAGSLCFIGDAALTDDLTIPANCKAIFEGTLSGSGQKLICDAADTFLFEPRLEQVDMELGLNSDGAVIQAATINGVDTALLLRSQSQFYQLRARNFTILNLTIEGGTHGFVNHGCEDGLIRRATIGAACEVDGWLNFGSRRLVVEDLETQGRWPASVMNLAFRSVSGNLGFIDTVYRRVTVRDFFDPANNLGEGISFDCHGNSPENFATVMTTTVVSESADGIEPEENTGAYGAYGYIACFQSGALAGRKYTVTYQGADGLGNWTLGDTWADDHALAVAGDIVSLQIDCRGNVIEDATVYCVEDAAITRNKRTGIVCWGMGGVDIINPTLIGGGGSAPIIEVTSLRGVGNIEQNWAVAHGVTVNDFDQADGEVEFRSFVYAGFTRPTSYSNAVEGCNAHRLRTELQSGFSNTSSDFDLIETE